MTWTDEDVAALKELWADHNNTCAEIAAAIGSGLSRNAIIGKVHRLKLPARATRFRKHNKAGVGNVGSGRIREIQKARSTVFHRPSLKPVAILKLAVDSVEMVPFPAARMVSLLDLNQGECKYPCGDPQERTFGFCANVALPGQPYCLHHHALCFVPAPRRVRVAA